MKFRMGFVTNSSSSSYVIAIKDIAIDQELIDQLPKFAQNVIKSYQKIMSQDAECIITNEEELVEYFLRWEDYETIEEYLDDYDYRRSTYKEWLEKLNQGYAIAVHDVDYHDESKVSMFRALEDDEQIIILESDY